MEKLTNYKIESYLTSAGWIDEGNYGAENRIEATKKMILEKYPKDIALCDNPYMFRTRYMSGYRDETKTTRCIICNSEFDEVDLEGSSCCPKCGTDSIPASITEDVNIKINWHELRILSIWAENWARQCDKKALEEGKPRKMLLCIMSIAERLQRQHADKTPLTLFSEIRELRKEFNIETDIDNDEKLGL